MGFHHVALATRDTAATHDFYTEVMGFSLVKVVVAPTPGEHGGWSKHFFYDTGLDRDDPTGDGGMIAFWEIHDTEIGTEFPVDINTTAGLPWWVNHIAFDAPTMEVLHAHRDRWRSHGHHVLEVDHEFCVSIYIRDPSGNMVEFCHTTRPFSADEIALAQTLVHAEAPDMNGHANAVVHKPIPAAATA